MLFQTWVYHFQANKSHFDHLDWNDLPLTASEKKIITSSIQQFQRGEYSEGKQFMQFAKSMKDDSYCEAVKTFIKEEQDHAMVLGKFMDLHQIPKIKVHSLDTIFRSLRKLAGLEGTITVLLTAEIISMVYYKALYAATNSRLLKQICYQILEDEKIHLRFQCFSLKLIYLRKIPLAILFSSVIHSLLMVGTILMVWLYHKKVFKSGQYGFTSFFLSVWKEFRQCRRMARGNTQLQGELATSTIPIRTKNYL